MPRAGLTREKIVEAAAALADEKGYEAVTLAVLARHFGVQLPSLYAHLANAEDLKKSLALLALDTLADKTEQALAGRSGKDALIALATTHREFARSHPGLMQAARHPLSSHDAANSSGPRLANMHRAMLRSYRLDDEAQVHATRLVGAFVLGFSLLELAGSFDHSAPDADISWLRAIDGLDALIRNWAAA